MDNKIWDLRFSKHGDGTGNAKTRSDSDVLSYLLQGARAHFKLGLGHLYVSISLYRRGLHQIPVSTLGALIVLIGAPAFWQHLRHRAGFSASRPSGGYGAWPRLAPARSSSPVGGQKRIDGGMDGICEMLRRCAAPLRCEMLRTDTCSHAARIAFECNLTHCF